jgi:hypothetical protein
MHAKKPNSVYRMESIDTDGMEAKEYLKSIIFRV